jgi:hypothetical protein
MFEYAALVDAPVQRFTGIVTGPDPLDEVVQAEPVPSRVAATAPTEMPIATAIVPAEPQAPPPSPPPSASSPFVPALVAVAAAGVTAMWWLRRGGHDRS